MNVRLFFHAMGASCASHESTHHTTKPKTSQIMFGEAGRERNIMVKLKLNSRSHHRNPQTPKERLWDGD
jgi:hypothetical protein